MDVQEMYKEYKNNLWRLYESDTITGMENALLWRCIDMAERIYRTRKESEYFQELGELNAQHRQQLQALKERFFGEKTAKAPNPEELPL